MTDTTQDHPRERLENVTIQGAPSKHDYDIDFCPSGEKPLGDDALTWAIKKLHEGAEKVEFDITEGDGWCHVKVTK